MIGKKYWLVIAWLCIALSGCEQYENEAGEVTVVHFHATKEMVACTYHDVIVLDDTIATIGELQQFYMDVTPVTYADFEKYIAAGGRPGAYHKYESYNKPNQPVTGLSWYHAMDYCNWRSLREGFKPYYIFTQTPDDYGYASVSTDTSANGYRLPTVKQWRKACFGAFDTLPHPYPWGPKMDDTLANYDTEHGYMTQGWWRLSDVTAGFKSANGIYGLVGNVWQMCEDEMINPESGNRVRRMVGGGWGSHDTLMMSIDYIAWSAPSLYHYDVGFRCVLPWVMTTTYTIADTTHQINDSLTQGYTYYSYAYVAPLQNNPPKKNDSALTQQISNYISDGYARCLYLHIPIDSQPVLTSYELAETIVQTATENGVNPLFLLGIMVSESGLGTVSFPRWFNNPMAFFWQNKLMDSGTPRYDAVPGKHNRKYRTLKEGFALFCKGIKNRQFYTKPLKGDLYAFHMVYVGYEAEEWINTLCRVYRDVARLRLEAHIPEKNIRDYIFIDKR